MVCMFMRLALFLGLWNVSCVSAVVEVMTRLITDNITDGDSAIYGGSTWIERFGTNLKHGVATVENYSYVSAGINSGVCIKTMSSSDCSDSTAVGVQFWMRYKGFMSDILDDNVEYHKILSGHLANVTPSNVRWISCFNSKHHGWDMTDFHTNCDRKGPTVSLFKVRNDAIFGGFTSADWGGSSYADQGFLFSLKNADNKSLPLLRLKVKGTAINSESFLGPSFGNNDLRIGNNPNQDGASNCSQLGTSYHLPANYQKGTVDARNLLAGSETFALSDMEVFYMECSGGLGMDSGTIPDSHITSTASNFSASNARLKSNTMTPISSPLEVQLNTISMVTGFTIRAQNCNPLNVQYQDPSRTMQSYSEGASPKAFDVPTNQSTRYVFTSSISTSKIQFNSSNTNCELAVEIHGCGKGTCNAALGMESKVIQDSQIKASHQKNNEPAIHGRLNLVVQDHKGCWKADDNKNHYLQIDLKAKIIITGIGVQGCADEDYYPKVLKIEYAVEGDNFVYYRGTGNSIKYFDTSSTAIRNAVKKINLIPPIVAQKIRLYAIDKTGMRTELYGCYSYVKDESNPTTVLSTGNFSYNATGFGVSVSGSSLQGGAITSSSRIEAKLPNAVTMATWTRVTYWTNIGSGNAGFLFANEAEASIKSLNSFSSVESSSAIVTIDHSCITKNPQNMQLSDVTVWTSASSSTNDLKTAVDTVVDGPVVFDANYISAGSVSIPYVVKSRWQVLKGCTPSQSKGTGPCIGSQNGGFLFLEATGASEGTTAVLESFYRVSAYKCFSFAYHMWGQNIARLNVYVRDFFGEKKLVWRLGGDRGNQWHQAQVPLSQPRAFKIIMEGVVGDGFQGDIAVDSFKFSTQKCVYAPPTASVTYATGFAKSNIIGGIKEDELSLMKYLERANAPHAFWTPCFIKSRGDALADFWKNCQGVGPTVTVAQYQGNVFGAYSDRDWSGSAGKGLTMTLERFSYEWETYGTDLQHVHDPNTLHNIASSKAFIFSLRNPASIARVFPVKPGSRNVAITIDSSHGPRFGQGFQVKDNLYVDTELGLHYGDNANYLTGSKLFNPVELEVFYAGDFPCDKWCALPDWNCKESNTKCECDYSDRLIGSCLKGNSQAFLGIFDSFRSPDAYFNFDKLPNIQNMKMHKSVSITLSSSLAQVSNGISRKAIKLDGNANVDLGNYSGTCLFNDSSDGLSVSLWLKYTTKMGADSQTLFTIGDADNTGEARLQIAQPNSTLEELSVLVNIKGRRLSYRFACPSNIWSHLVIAWSNSEPSLILHRNGKSVNLTYDICFGCNSTGMADKNIYLGAKDAALAPVAYFDEIGVWCRALSAKEAEEIYEFFKGPPGFYIFLSFAGETWSDYQNFESPNFDSFKNDIISKIQAGIPSVTASNVTFHCSGPGTLTCNVTIGVGLDDGDTAIPVFNGPLKNYITGYSQTSVQNKDLVLSGYNTSAYSINVTLEMPNEDDSSSGIYQQYSLLYHPMADPSLLVNITEEKYKTLWSLENLTSYTPYNISVQLSYLGGTFRTAKSLIWSGERAPDGPPLNFEAIPLNSSCIKLQWQDPEAPIPGLLRGFQINYTKANDPAAVKKTEFVQFSSQPIHWKNVCDLLPETSYQFQIAAFTVAFGLYTAVAASFTMGIVPTLPPEDLTSLNGTAPNDPASTCLLTWTPPPTNSINGNLTSYRVAYTNLRENKTFYSEMEPCNSSKLLKDLDAYTVYKVFVSVANNEGTGPQGGPAYCHTESTVPGAAPTDFKAKGVGKSCHVQWGQVPEHLRNGLILGYNITYFKIDDPSATLKFVVVQEALSNTSVLTGLEPFTKYNISIVAFTDKGHGNESGFAECLTEETAPDGVPLNLAVLEKTNVSCTFSWAKIPDALANGRIRGYELVIHNVNTSDPEGIFVGFQMTCALKLNSTFTNLKPFHMYNITVAGFNSKGISNKSEPLQCLTDEDVPLMPPPNLRCQNKSSTIIEVCWDEVPLIYRQGIVREYKVHFEVVDKMWWFAKTENDTVTTPPVLCWNLTDLEEYTSYSIKVKAVTVKEGNFSEIPKQCKTSEGVPRDPPANVSGYNTSAYSLMVKWGDVPREQPGIIRGYVVSYRVWNASEDTTVSLTVSSSMKSLVILGLERFTLYCVKVAAKIFEVGQNSSACAYISTDSKWLPPPDGIPSNLTEAFNSTESTCSLKWSKSNNSDPDPDGRVLGYNVYYRIVGTNSTEQMIQVTGENSTYQVLQSLEEYTNYEIQIAAYNLFGAGNKSEIMYCHTKEDAPSEPPANITALNASSTSIRVNWLDMPRFDQNGIIRKYYIIVFERALGISHNITLTYIPSNVAGRRRRRREISIDEHTQTITGLKKFTEYGIQMYGYTIKKGPISPVVYVKTAEDAPTTIVRNLTIHNSSSSSILLEWNNVPPEHMNGIIRSFVIYYWKTDWPLIDEHNITVGISSVRVSPGSSRRKRRSLSTTPEFRFNLTGLQIWRNYSLQVAPNTIKVGPRTNETVVSTDEDVPCLPPNYITFDIPAESSLLVRWEDVLRHCRNGIILGFRLIYAELPSSQPVMVNFTASEYSYIIKNMNVDANYTLELMAFTRKGNGNSSFDLAQPDKMGPRTKPINITTFNFTTPTTLTVEWKAIQEDFIEEKLLGYRVSWRALSEGEEVVEDAPWYNFTVRKNTLQTLIKGLKNFVHYQIEVSGFTRGGNGPSGVVWGDTCRCSKRITTNYRIFAPYNSVSVSADLKSVNMSGMIPEILNNLTVECCQTCKAHGTSYVDFVQNGRNMSAFQHNEMDVKTLIDDTNDLSFPVYGWKWQDRYQGIYRYIPLVESPGFAFLLLEPETGSPLKAIVKSILETWPYLLITMLMALLAGIILWFLDTAYNEEQFPHSFMKGAGNGWWWAFISMTTLGYGDKVPAANHAKAFAVIWVLIGLVVYGILSGSITTAFTSIIYQFSTRLYGAKVATINDTPEFRFAVRRKAQVNTEGNYTSFEQVLQALMDRKVAGMLMDAYEAGTKRKQFIESGGRIRIHKVYDFSSTFGVVLAGPSTRLYQCSRNWMSGHRAEMSAHIAKFLQVVEEEEVNELVEITTGLFDPNSAVFQDFFRYSLIAMVVLLVPGIIWEIIYQLRKKKKNKLEDSSPTHKLKETLLHELGSFTTSFLQDLECKLTELREKHQSELKGLLRQRTKHKDNDSFHTEKGLLPIERLIHKKFPPTR